MTLSSIKNESKCNKSCAWWKINLFAVEEQPTRRAGWSVHMHNMHMQEILNKHLARSWISWLIDIDSINLVFFFSQILYIFLWVVMQLFGMIFNKSLKNLLKLFKNLKILHNFYISFLILFSWFYDTPISHYQKKSLKK